MRPRLPAAWYVLLYHEVAWEAPPHLGGIGGMIVPPDRFRDQFERLADAGRLIGVTEAFTSAADMSGFISQGCSTNLQYGTNGVCEPSGQMPGFGFNSNDFAREHGPLLTAEQIDAIVAYERSLR